MELMLDTAPSGYEESLQQSFRTWHSSCLPKIFKIIYG